MERTKREKRIEETKNKCRFDWIYSGIYFCVISFSNPNRKPCSRTFKCIAHASCAATIFYLLDTLWQCCATLFTCFFLCMYVSEYVPCTHETDTTIVMDYMPFRCNVRCLFSKITMRTYSILIEIEYRQNHSFLQNRLSR